jgi:glycosyltransferase involved in cell wall biosynthesis
LARHGIDLEIAPLFGDDYVRALYGQAGRARHVLHAFAGRLHALLSARKFDAVWIEKEALPWLPAFVELSLLPRGIPLIADYDDAVFHRYDQHGSLLVRAVLGRKLDRVMARVDLVVAGNAYLADHARKAGARRVEIVPTVVDLDRYLLLEHPHADEVTIGWIGSPKTAAYLDAVKPVIGELTSAMPLQAIAIGARADQLAGSCFTPVPWSEESEVAQLRRIDIGIMPLEDTPWERGKCGYKLIQYMALGLPVVASPVGVNRQIVRHGENGFLASAPAEWRDALEKLATDPALRRSFGAAGRSDIEDRYALSVQAPHLAELIEAVVTSRSG